MVYENSILCTSKGLFRIKDLTEYSFQIIKETDRYNVLDIQGLGRSGGVKDYKTIYKNSIEKTTKLITNMGFQLEGSSCHLVSIIRHEKEEVIKLMDIKENDYLAFRVNTRSSSTQEISTNEWESIWKSQQELQNFSAKQKTNIYRYPNTINSRICYLMGILVGDGSYSSKTGYHMIDYVSADQELIDQYREIIQEAFGADVSICPTRNIQRAYICSKYIREFFNFYGLSYCKGKFKSVPWSVLQNTLDCQKAFLRGLFDTDGGVNNSVIHFTNIAEELVDTMMIMLLNIGIIASKRSLTKETEKWSAAWRIQITGQSALLFKEEIGFICHHKQASLEKLCEPNLVQKIPKCNRGAYPLSPVIGKEIFSLLPVGISNDRSFFQWICRIMKGKSFFYYYQLDYLIEKLKHYKIILPNLLVDWKGNNVFYDKIVNITTGFSLIYNLLVTGDHSFVANGIINYDDQEIMQKNPNLPQVLLEVVNIDLKIKTKKRKSIDQDTLKIEN